MNTCLRKTAVATLSATLLFTTAGGAEADKPPEGPDDKKKPPEATTTILCEAASSNRENKDRYDGRSASYMYDKRFTPGPALGLTTFTPQGLTYWKNWNDKDDLLLVTAYKADTLETFIIGLDPKINNTSVILERPTDAAIGTVLIKVDHAGGIAIHDDWLFVSDGPHTIQTFKMSDLRKAMKESSTDSSTGQIPPARSKLEPVDVTTDLYGASFLAVDSSERKLYAGLFNADGRDWMYRYTIGKNGALSLDRKKDGKCLRWEIPANTQGITLTKKHFIFSSSHDRDFRSNIYVTDRNETNLDKASVRCFRAPSMAEGLATDGKHAYLLFESGSNEYNGSSGNRARNVIGGVHKAQLSDLTGLPGGKLHLGTLQSKKQQDRRGNDEIRLMVEEQQLGKKVVQIDKGDKKKIDETVQFTGKASVKLYEKDPKGDKDDYLGERTLKPGGKDGVMKFTKRGAHYRLSYKLS